MLSIFPSNHLVPSKQQTEKIVDASIKSIISTVLERCKKESNTNSLVVPLEEYEQRASYYTAFPKSFLWQLQDEEKNRNVKVESFTTAQRITIAICVKQFYAHRTQPTYMLLYDTVKEIREMPEFIQFRREMSDIGYEYRTTSIGPLLVEDPELRYKRFHFLNKMRKARSIQKPIYYLDIRILDKTLTFKKFTENIVESNKIEDLKYIFLHVISKDGLENSLHSNTLTQEDFIKWVTDVFITPLNPGAIIVLDHDLFTSQLHKPISRYSSKSDMLKWLQDDHIPCDVNMHKAELWELINASKGRKSDYQIDNILKAHGFEVLRIPYKFEDLTPTDLLWKRIQGYKNTFRDCPNMIKLRHVVDSFINNIDAAELAAFFVTVENWEKAIFDLDVEIENLLDKEYKFDTDQINNNCSIPPYFYNVEN